MRDGQSAMPVAVPPVQFHDIVEIQVGDQIENMMRNHDGRCYAASALGLPHNRPQGRPVQMVKVSVGDKHQVDRRQVAYLQARSVAGVSERIASGQNWDR